MAHASVIGIAAALSVLASVAAHAQPGGIQLPAGEGRDLLASACTACHGLGTIVQMRDGPAGWKHQVENMVLRGAQLNGSEVETVVRYLSANFGPGSQKPMGTQAAVTLPEGAGKQLVEVHCALCHDLGRIAAVKRSKSDWEAVVANMVNRGAQASPEDARAIAGYLADKFGAN